MTNNSKPKVYDVIVNKAPVQDTFYFCRMYKCPSKSVDDTGYCEKHKSVLRTGKPLYTQGSCPVIIRSKEGK